MDFVDSLWEENRRLFPTILLARTRLRSWLPLTSFRKSISISRQTSVEVFLKLENTLPTGSFKLRGAFNKLLTILDEARKYGIVTASTGNHGLAVAFAAQRIGNIPATIFLPKNIPDTKLLKFGRYETDLKFTGQTVEEVYAAAQEYCRDSEKIFISIYDDPDIVAANGLIALEMLYSVRDLDAIIVPVGAGLLISGITIATKILNPTIEIISVQPVVSPVLRSSLAAGYCLEDYSAGPTICDGLAGGMGHRAFDLARIGLIDRLVEVDEDSIEDAIVTLYKHENLIVEGSGAVGIAALTSGALLHLVGKKVGVILTGGNLDTQVLASILSRRGK